MAAYKNVSSDAYRYGDEQKFLEKLFFNHRVLWLSVITVITLFFGYELRYLKVDSGFEKMLPMEHPYLKNMFTHLDDLMQKGLGFKIVVENPGGDIYDKEYLQVVKQVHERVFYINGVDRTTIRDMWAPTVRWIAVTPKGFEGDLMIPGDYDGSPESLERVRRNVLRSTEIGRTVADNFKSTTIEAYMFTTYPSDDLEHGHMAGDSLDFKDVGHVLESIRTEIHAKYKGKYRVYIIGEPKMIGDLIDGFSQIMLFGVIAIAITLVLLYVYSRCWRSSLVPLVASVVAVIWQLGVLSLMARFNMPYGDSKYDVMHGIGVFSMLVPFLMVAIGVSHSVQFVNVMLIEAAKGNDKMMSARKAFRQNYLPGLTALITNIIGFGTMFVIPIGAIKELAITASVGITVIIITKIILLPILLSYTGVSEAGIKHMQESVSKDTPHWNFFAKFTEFKWALASLVIASLGAVYGFHEREGLKIGDITKGSPELRPDSVYNKDTQFITSNYATSSDLFVVMMITKPEECSKLANLEAMDNIEWMLQNVPGVQSTASAAFVSRQVIMALSEGHIKWLSVGRNQSAIDGAFGPVMENGLVNVHCSFAPVVAFLEDHKAETLERVVKATEKYIAENKSPDHEFLLATGNAGIGAAVNQEIGAAQQKMMLWVYGVVGLLVLLTFPSIRAMLCIVLPLGLTSVLCEALMAHLGIGIKVATLPVVALGVGIGVDYGIYLYSRLESFLKEGQTLKEAYLNTLKTTGKAVAFTGFTLAIGVATWYFSDIQFQKDMGILLMFMFLWNMFGALWLLPSLAHFLIRPDIHAKAAVAPKQQGQTLLALADFELFKDLDENCLTALAECVKEIELPANANVFSHNDSGDEVFLVRRGSVNILLPLEGGHRSHLLTVERGDLFGELSFLDQSPRSADAEVKEPASLYVLSRARVDQLCHQKPEIGPRLFTRLALSIGKRLRQASAVVQELEER